jgi:hypothetical protein
MSWSITIGTDKDVTDEDIALVVFYLPSKFRDKCNGAMRGSRQSWGWSLAVDVQAIQNPREVVCSGSCGISGNIAEEFCEEFAKLISKHLNCIAKVGRMSV